MKSLRAKSSFEAPYAPYYLASPRTPLNAASNADDSPAPRAGADLVLPVQEIGRVVADIVGGAPLPEPSPRESAAGAGPINSGDPNSNFPELWPNSVNSAATRREFARLRAVELRRRRRDLSSGLGATAQTVATAQRRADESRRRAQLAQQAAEEAAARWEERLPIR